MCDLVLRVKFKDEHIVYSIILKDLDHYSRRGHCEYHHEEEPESIH